MSNLVWQKTVILKLNWKFLSNCKLFPAKYCFKLAICRHSVDYNYNKCS
jgi:hypothetical protein